MQKFDSKNFTWGMEIEWGDVNRELEIPIHLGSWEHAETDIINLNEPYKNVCCDPLGIEPPFGGEINTKPTKTWQEQVDRYYELEQFFIDNGNQPTVCTTSHTHIHCYVPGLKGDVDSLKRLTKYIKENQQVAIDRAYGFYEPSNMKLAKNAKMYMKFDGGRPMPDYMCNNIINLATDFDHFIKLHAAGKDGVSMGRPFRYAVNMYSMKHIGTVEFRLFRSTLDKKQIESCFRFVNDFMDAALNDGPDVLELIMENDYKFPPMIWDLNQFLGWIDTKYDKERGKKAREYLEVE
jgi:hypothetical protein